MPTARLGRGRRARPQAAPAPTAAGHGTPGAGSSPSCCHPHSALPNQRLLLKCKYFAGEKGTLGFITKGKEDEVPFIEHLLCALLLGERKVAVCGAGLCEPLAPLCGLCLPLPASPSPIIWAAGAGLRTSQAWAPHALPLLRALRPGGGLWL